MQHALHHHHIRKRIYRNLEKYPSPRMLINSFDHLIYFAAFLGPAFTVPQAYMVFAQRSAEGLSFTSWVAYLGLSVVWLIYGIIHNEKPIIFSNILWILMNGLVVWGILLYG